MKTMSERTKNLISYKTNASKRFKELEELTRIPGATWRTWWTKDKPPSGEMIESIGAIWPEYLFWMITGVTDSAHGHIAIPDGYQVEINLLEKPDQISSIRYIRKKVEIHEAMCLQDRIELTKEEISEIYNFRCVRDTEQLGYLSRNSARKKDEIVGYFDPRMIKHINNESNES